MLLSMMVSLFALSILLLDVLFAVLRRFLRNQSIFSADGRHMHHRLLDRGMSPRRAAMVLYLGATAAALLALVISMRIMGKFQNLLILVCCILFWAGIRALRYSEFDLVRRMLFSGDFQ